MFAVMATALLCSAALATEGGLLYLTRRNAQNAADAAAIAAASAHQYRGRTAALAAATEVAQRNGFSTGVTVNNPPTTGASAGNGSAFEVHIQKSVSLALSSLLTRQASTVVDARAVALLHGQAPACLVALSGSITIQNSSNFNAANCAVASNAPGTSVNIPQSNSTVRTNMVNAVGTCNGCTNSRWNIGSIREHAAPVSNPYAYLDSIARPTVSGASCLNTAPLNANGPIQPTGTTRAYCSSVTVSNTSAVTFSPGIYVFQNASLTVGSISSFACAGCSFIFTGTTPGTLSLSNTSTVTISAPTTSGTAPDYAGVLFYRVPPTVPSGTSANPTLNLQSVSTFNLTGGIYFPQGYVKIGNVSSTSNTSCMALVAGTLEIGSLSSYRFDVSNCPSYNTPVPTIQVARLVE
jgi:hypothetical protein